MVSELFETTDGLTDTIFSYLLPPPDGVFKSDWNLLSGLFPPCEILSSGWISFRQMVRLTLIWFFSYTSAADWFDELTRRHSLQIFNCKLTLLLGHQPDMEILDPLHGWTEWIRQYDVDGVDRQVLPWSVSADGQQVLFFKQSLPWNDCLTFDFMITAILWTMK